MVSYSRRLEWREEEEGGVAGGNVRDGHENTVNEEGKESFGHFGRERRRTDEGGG